MTDEPWYQNVSMPVLLRHARRTYGDAMRAELVREGYDDIPASGLYVIGSLALGRAGVPIGQLVRDLGITKQGAGQLVDTLVTRGYVQRTPDERDRRQLIVTLTERGRAAAKTQMAARTAIDAALLAVIGEADLERSRRALAALIDLGRRSAAGEKFMSENGRFTDQPPKGAAFRRRAMSGTLFEDVDLSEARFVDVALQSAKFQNVNMTGVSIDDANITGLTICGHDVQALIRDHEAGAASADASGDGSQSAVDKTIPSGNESARAFLPSKEFGTSKAFYEAIGCTKLLDSDVAIFSIGATAVILTRHYQKDWAENCMMQLMVDDLDAWWKRIETLDLTTSFGIPAPKPPAIQPWGLRVGYLVDPAGVLWHIAQRRAGSGAD